MTIQNSSIDTSLSEAIARFEQKNPASLAQHQAASAVLPGGNTRSVLYHEPFPMALSGGDGCYVISLDGKRYLDALGEYTAGLFGHSNPVIRQALDAALDGGLVLGGHTRTEAEFAAVLCARFPALDRVRFTNSGTEANLLALSLARTLTKRGKIMVADGAYHGSMLTFAVDNPLNAPFDVVKFCYNRIETAEEAARDIDDDLAAIIVEPMMGSGGCIPATRDFLAALRDLAGRTGALLIFDEVMTSRLAPGGLQEKHGITPDLMTLGKYVGGGMSFGAFGGRADLMARLDPSAPGALMHAGTFNNNVMTMTAGLTAMTKVYTPDVVGAHNARGDGLRDRLNRICREAGVAFLFSGLGSLLTAHPMAGPLDTYSQTRAVDQRLKALFFFDMVDQGIWLARRGMINLSLPMGPAEMDRIADAVSSFVHLRKGLLT
ncbi:aspartate aminotransferase family protein [Mesorhizobium sp. B4-1-4]|uniref:aspartate aminotransferase family protein n=1 Tax=Mesorhizobium sp. B4-1-4 TaxID=2589888 RepID=UPI00112E2565|nr:aminotransferase class III-fold pyridoxal phosphate-dependent enzyme [Mesorhizobium sp. B4-1-4]UCI31918.1 aminotransferase class III-fold pyridoxal phosphate-dependent enzyme [Mesorhizobium sp. B4-1-4]